MITITSRITHNDTIISDWLCDRCREKTAEYWAMGTSDITKITRTLYLCKGCATLYAI